MLWPRRGSSRWGRSDRYPTQRCTRSYVPDPGRLDPAAVQDRACPLRSGHYERHAIDRPARSPRTNRDRRGLFYRCSSPCPLSSCSAKSPPVLACGDGGSLLPCVARQRGRVEHRVGSLRHSVPRYSASPLSEAPSIERWTLDSCCLPSCIGSNLRWSIREWCWITSHEYTSALRRRRRADAGNGLRADPARPAARVLRLAAAHVGAA